MSVSSINNTSSYISLPSRAERIATIDNRIADNNRQIANLENQIIAQQEVSAVIREKITNNENQITAQQEVSTTLKEMMVNNTDSINITKELINNNNNNIYTIKEIIGNNEKQIANNNENIGIIKEIIGNNEKLINNNNKSIYFLQETQVIAKEAHDIGESRLKNLQETQVIAKEAHAIGESRLKNLQETQVFAKETLKLEIEQRDLLQECKDIIEKMLAIVMKNPSKYEGMSLKDFSEVPEVADIKKNLNEVVEIKVKDYPQEHHNDLMNVASKVIDHSLEKKSLVNLEQKIDLALSKEILIKIDKFDKSPVSIYRTNQYLYNQHYFSNIKNYN